MKKIFILFLVLFFNSVFAQNLDEITKNVPKMGSIKCRFTQEKYIKNLEKPLISKGDFEYIENKGVYFYTKYPYQSVTDYTNEKNNQINDIVNAVSSKKYSKLEREFNFEYGGNITSWNLKMTPKENSSARNFIVSVSISGTDYINKINIVQKNGNKTIIWFTK